MKSQRLQEKIKEVEDKFDLVDTDLSTLKSDNESNKMNISLLQRRIGGNGDRFEESKAIVYF